MSNYIQKLKSQTNDAVRMMGHLLEHHPTTGFYAKNSQGLITNATSSEASSFCFIGAAQAVAWSLAKANGNNLLQIAANELGWPDIWTHATWDCATDTERLNWARQLQKATIYEDV